MSTDPTIHPFLKKTLSTLGTEGNFLSCIKSDCQRARAQLTSRTAKGRGLPPAHARGGCPLTMATEQRTGGPSNVVNKQDTQAVRGRKEKNCTFTDGVFHL